MRQLFIALGPTGLPVVNAYNDVLLFPTYAQACEAGNVQKTHVVRKRPERKAKVIAKGG